MEGGAFIEWRTTHGYMAQMMMCYLLRNAFFEYEKKNNGLRIPPSPVINDEAAWRAWRGRDD